MENYTYRTTSLNKLVSGLMLTGVDEDNATEYFAFKYKESGLVEYEVVDERVIKNIGLYNKKTKDRLELMMDICKYNRMFRKIKEMSKEYKGMRYEMCL